MAEKENPGIFNDSSDIGSLFESVTDTPTIDLESEKVDLFSDKEEETEEILSMQANEEEKEKLQS
jgi:Mor family transcriptional regulator